jgi:hypothetical protein
MRRVAAAPLLFDDLPVSSPELALVDADLAAQLRADLSSGEAFRPRQVARPAYLSLIVDAGAPDLAPAAPHVDDEGVELSVEPVDVVPAYVVLPEEKTDDVVVEDEVADVAESFDQLVAPVVDDAIEELPDYVVQDDVAVADVPEPVVLPEELDLEDPVAAVAASLDDPVPPVVDETIEELPDYIVRSESIAVLPAPVVPDDVSDRDAVSPELEAEASADEAQSRSDYPILPDLDERIYALEETEAALRKIREQMGGVTPTAKPKSRFRRRFTVASGICVVGALAVYAAEVQLGVLQAPGFLVF